MPIGIAVLGVGRWGVHLLRNFQQHPQARIVAVVDSVPERLAYCQEKFGLAESEVVLATDWQAVRQLKTIEAVAIATPASTHYPLITEALTLGYHVLAEKPLTLDPAECLKLVRLAEQNQRLLMVDHTYLFHPAVEQGQQIIQSGQLGELRYGYASRTNLGPVRQDVDALWDLAIHDIAIFNAWLGQTPSQVQATGSTWLQKDKALSLSAASATSPGLADLVWANLIYPNGFCAHLHLCWLNPDKQRRLCVVGTQGTLVFDEIASSLLTLEQGYLQQQEAGFFPVGVSRQAVSIVNDEPLRRVCDRFLADIQSTSGVEVSSGWMGAQLVQILSCLSQSLQQQGEIVTVPSTSSL